MSVFVSSRKSCDNIVGTKLKSEKSSSKKMTTFAGMRNHISGERAKLGSLQARLDSWLSALTTTKEQSQATASQIIDIDVAEESANLARRSIVAQAASSVLAQASLMPQIALALITGRGSF